MNVAAAAVAFDSFLRPSNCRLVIAQDLKRQKGEKEKRSFKAKESESAEIICYHIACLRLMAILDEPAITRDAWFCSFSSRVRSTAPGAVSSWTQPSKWLLAKRLSLAFTQLAAHLHNKFTLRTPAFPLTHTHTRTWLHTYHALSAAGSERCWWTTVPPLCFTLLHLELWASCIFNWRNLHRRPACQCELSQWGCLRPWSTFTLQLLLRGPKMTNQHKPLRGRIADFLSSIFFF